MPREGENYILNVERVIPANTIETFIYDLTSVAGAVRLDRLTHVSNQIPRLAPFDILVSRFAVERFDSTRREEVLVDGNPSLLEVAGDAERPGFLPAYELMLARGRVRIGLQNTTTDPIRVSLTIWGVTLYGYGEPGSQQSAITEQA